MQLTANLLRRFVDGQIEMQNPLEAYLYRGQIKEITVEGSGDEAALVVQLDWMAKGEGYPPVPHRWVKDTTDVYKAPLLIYAASDIGQGRIALHSFILQETVVLFPEGVGNTLDRAYVEGL